MAIGFDDLQETIILIHPVANDEWGDPLSTGTATSVTLPGALFAPGATREIEVNGDQVQADGTLFLDPQSDINAITATDRIRIRGELYEVAGKPRYWNQYFTEVPVRIVTG